MTTKDEELGNKGVPSADGRPMDWEGPASRVLMAGGVLIPRGTPIVLSHSPGEHTDDGPWDDDDEAEPWPLVRAEDLPDAEPPE